MAINTECAAGSKVQWRLWEEIWSMNLQWNPTSIKSMICTLNTYFVHSYLMFMTEVKDGSSALLLQRSLLPGGIILQGVLLLQGSTSVFACHYG
jgi:hypothetical protein